MNGKKIVAFFKSREGIALSIAIVVAIYIYRNDIKAWYYKNFSKLPATPPAYKPDFSLVLKKGTIGKEVEILQSAMVADGETLPKFGIDGIFGSETEGALFRLLKVKQITLSDYQKMKTDTKFDFNAIKTSLISENSERQVFEV